MGVGNAAAVLDEGLLGARLQVDELAAEQTAAARLATVAAARCLLTATNRSQNSYTTSGDTTPILRGPCDRVTSTKAENPPLLHQQSPHATSPTARPERVAAGSRSMPPCTILAKTAARPTRPRPHSDVKSNVSPGASRSTSSAAAMPSLRATSSTLCGPARALCPDIRHRRPALGRGRRRRERQQTDFSYSHSRRPCARGTGSHPSVWPIRRLQQDGPQVRLREGPHPVGIRADRLRVIQDRPHRDRHRLCRGREVAPGR